MGIRVGVDVETRVKGLEGGGQMCFYSPAEKMTFLPLLGNSLQQKKKKRNSSSSSKQIKPGRVWFSVRAAGNASSGDK